MASDADFFIWSSVNQNLTVFFYISFHFLLYGTSNTFNIAGETGSYLIEKMCPGFPSDVLQVLCLKAAVS